MFAPFMPVLGTVVISVFTAVSVLLIMIALPLRQHRSRRALVTDTLPEQTVFLLENRELVDATKTARVLLDSLPQQGSEWDRIQHFLGQQFPGIEDHFQDGEYGGDFEISGGAKGRLRLRVRSVGRKIRLTIVDLQTEGQGIWVDGLSQLAQEAELEALRETMAAAPLLIWRTNEKAEIVWANDAYLDRAMSLARDDEPVLTWPLPVLFEEIPAEPKGDEPRRISLKIAGESEAQWYEWKVCASPGGRVFFAFPANEVVKAETTLQEFIQNLTKTFAHLPIGLAVFDRQRRLAMFNPALVDLTALEVTFLSARPTLFDFLDQLRESQMIPEPKNYHDWRGRVAALEAAAVSGLFEEIWSLATGQTYKVTGLPHPGGALALQIEDISAETALCRLLRSEIELSHEVFDTLEEAVAIFSTAGELILSNAAYSKLWLVEPSTTLGVVGIVDSMRQWQSLCLPSPVWGDIRDFVISMDDRVDWNADVTMRDGRVLEMRISPLSNGRTLVGFTEYAGNFAFGTMRANAPQLAEA